MKDGKEDSELMGLLDGGAIRFGKNPDEVWITFGMESPVLKENKLKRDFE